MANTRKSMRKIRELLKFHYEHGYSVRKAARAVGIGRTSASEYIAGFKASCLGHSSVAGMSDSELLSAITHKKGEENSRYAELYGQFPYFEKELKRTGVTLQLLWKEYSREGDGAYGYSQFCHHFYQWRKAQKVSMRQEHRAGDKMFVDFTGKKLSVTDPETGGQQIYEVFVAVLGASQLSYIEAVATQTKADWISANQNALRYFGGAPAAIVPDCLKSAVTKANKYEPEINRSFQDFAGHYGTVILPARALHPKDKSLAENFVRCAYREIFAPLRNIVFFSLEELNQSLWEQLEVYNQRDFQGKGYSRRQLFEQVEKSELKALNTISYELKEYCTCKVQYNHHLYLKEDKHYYSAPYRYTGKHVTVSYTAVQVEIFHNNQRVALHKRNRHPYGYTTENSHRPAGHQFQAKWTPGRLLDWGSSIGPEAEQVVSRLLDGRPHPEQAYRACMGLLSLEKKHDRADYIKACAKALALDCLSYKFIKNTLESKSFNMGTEEELGQLSLPEHGNIRGQEYYN